jgi:poly-gamma-glutamate capsule biosynthesis protein CapA/YwtB (metallophosphatase superfamily)
MAGFFPMSRTLVASACGVLLWVAAMPLTAQTPTLTVTLTGQSMIRGDIREHAPEAVPFIKSLLKDSDVKFTNFEATIVDEHKGQKYTDGRFLSPPSALEALQAFGFNLLAVSNNHSFDMKTPGIINTLEQTERLGIPHAGLGRTLQDAAAPAYLKTRRGTVALISMASGLIREGAAATPTSPGVNELRVVNGQPNAEDTARILRSIREARAQADMVIVYEHNHVFDKAFRTIMIEELPERMVPPEWLKKWTHDEIDAGADIVVMHGAPLIHGVEVYKGKPIFYDLGNFIFQAPPRDILLDGPLNWESVVAYVEFQDRKLQSIRFQPIAQNKIGQGNPDIQNEFNPNLFLRTRGLPKPVDGEQAHYILQRLVELSRPFGTAIDVNGSTATVRLTEGK